MADAASVAPPVRGAFLQMSNTRGATFWRDAVRAMAALNMNQVIVQTEAYLRQDGSLNAIDRALISAVLDEARIKGMRVWLGLVLPEFGNGSEAAARDRTFIDTVIAASRASADRIFSQFGAHAAFAGWYVPLELWTPGAAGQLGELGDYVRTVSAYCRGKAALDVAISPFISDLAATANHTQAEFTTILTGSAVTVVMLQDGVGARNVPTSQFPARVRPFMEAMKRACASAGCALWANVESFRERDGNFVPAPFGDFSAQCTAARAVTDNLITFEFSHFWMAAGPGGALAKALHDGYAAAFVRP